MSQWENVKDHKLSTKGKKMGKSHLGAVRIQDSNRAKTLGDNRNCGGRSNCTKSTLCSQFMRFRIMRFSIYAVLENGPNSCFMLQYSHIMRFLFKIIVYKILLIFFLHLCDSCILGFLLGNKKRINGELSVVLHFIPII